MYDGTIQIVPHDKRDPPAMLRMPLGNMAYKMAFVNQYKRTSAVEGRIPSWKFKKHQEKMAQQQMARAAQQPQQQQQMQQIQQQQQRQRGQQAHGPVS
jgi:hypothetical protein